MHIFFLGIYSFFLAIVWGLFVVVKIYADQHTDFSLNRKKITKLVVGILSFLTLIGFVLIFLSDEQKIFGEKEKTPKERVFY